MAQVRPRDFTQAEFQRALELIRPKLNTAQFQMLKAHFSAPNCVLTANDLAAAAGYDNFGPANSQYGKIGTMLRKALGPPGLRYPGQSNHIFQQFDRPHGAHPYWRLTLRPAFAAALKALGWFAEIFPEISTPSEHQKAKRTHIEGTRARASREQRDRAPRDFLSYWIPDTAKRELETGTLLDHAASDQYRGIQEDDRVYIASVWPGGQLVLLGRIVVGRRVDHQMAFQITKSDDLWEAEWHIFAKKGTAEPIAEIDLSDLAAELEFEGERRRLTVTKGRVNAQQLQSMRRITAATAKLLSQRLRSAREAERRIAEAIAGAGQGFGDPASNRETEVRAVAFVAQHYKAKGWHVVTRESENLGFDLLCTRNGEELRVEVKGARATGPAFILTENELATAEADTAWHLAIVTEVFSQDPQLYLVSGQELKKYFVLRPMAHRGTPRRDPAPLLANGRD